ncbi:MAG TPA: hypothetical protein VN046_04365 [Stenotrophobium sp.]|jgi:hypothetical protein|nr:hypothetical protein [Stenotrophobium sp.]
MKIALAIERSLDVPANYEQARQLLHDVEGTIRRFPKLHSLKKIGESDYLSEMNPMGARALGISHRVSYAARYAVDHGNGLLRWEPLRKHGNAQIGGKFQLSKTGGGTRLTFGVNGELDEVPVPLMYRLLAPAFIQGKFTRLVDIFLEQTHAALLALPAAEQKSPRKRATGNRK